MTTQPKKPTKSRRSTPRSTPRSAPEALDKPEEKVIPMAPPSPPPPATLGTADDLQVVPDGDYAGMTYDEVLKITQDQVNEALGGLTPRGAAAVVDMTMQEVLMVIEHCEGKVAAKEAALNFCQTALPYAMLDISLEPDRPKSLKEVREQFIQDRWGFDSDD